MFGTLFIVVVVILIVWWLLTRNAESSTAEMPPQGGAQGGAHDGAHGGAQSETHGEVHAEHAGEPAPAASAVAEELPKVFVMPAESESAAAPAPTAEPAAPVVEDDLIIIEGIGPKINAILKSNGILTFAQLAQKSPQSIKQILLDAGLRLGDPTSWPEQARLAAAGDMEGLQKLQDSLKGGREV